ncbi:MAG TPA: universal stress protein [Pirellulales bacterium]|jgi:nucleotide-binding universal stress UspA family protein|nr:universal stress protein [Pirellulales bacterium]
MKPIFEKILVPIDFSDASLVALSRAVTLAKSLDATVTVVHAIPPVSSGADPVIGPDAMMVDWRSPASASELEHRLREGAERQLRAAVDPYLGQGLDLHFRTLWGAPFIEVIHAVQEEAYDLVVVGTRGRSAIARMLVGSTSTKLVRKCPCPVWVVKPDAKMPFEAVLAPIDFSEVSHESLRLAGELAAHLNSSLHVLHVFAREHDYLLDLMPEDDFELRVPRRHELISQLRAFAKDSGLKIEPILHAKQGDVTPQILSTAEEVDAGLIVMGTLGRAGVSGLLIGNTAEKVLHASCRSLLAIKPPGYVSPVPARLAHAEA